MGSRLRTGEFIKFQGSIHTDVLRSNLPQPKICESIDRQQNRGWQGQGQKRERKIKFSPILFFSCPL